MERTRILIVSGSDGFPNGTGSSARMRAYAQGLTRLGARAEVLVVAALAPRSGPNVNMVARGEWRGVPFEFMHGMPGATEGWIRRRLLELRALRRAVGAIRASAADTPRTAVILVTPLMRWIVPFWVTCGFARVPLVHERSEFPFVYEADPGPLGRVWRRLYSMIAFRLFDGAIVISTLLEEYVAARVRRGAWVLRIPILVDAEVYACTGPGTPGVVGYAGNIAHRDELAQIVGAIARISATHDDVRGRIVGGGSAEQTASLREEIARQGVEDRIELMGPVRADEMPAALCTCAALALPRAEGLFSSAGMPTKLGEYLATGRPVVVTATGDIPRYLRSGENAFVVPPGDADAFTTSLESALFDAGSMLVGQAGRDLARSEFDPRHHMQRLLDALARDWQDR